MAKKQTTRSTTKSKRKKNSSGFLFFFLVILIALGGVLYTLRDKLNISLNSNNIEQSNNTLNNTKGRSNLHNFIDRFKSGVSKSSAGSSSSLSSKPSEKTTNNTSSKYSSSSMVIRSSKSVESKSYSSLSSSASTNISSFSSSKSASKSSVSSSISSLSSISSISSIQSSTAVNKTEKTNEKTYSGKVYFAKISDDEKIFVQSVSRNIRYIDSPLIETLAVLISGPLKSEQNKEIISCIPPKTRLLSAKVKSGVAYLNFSKEFEFNPYGREGTYNQLKQIVFTATQFPTVKAVKILIEGKEKVYIGGEGIMINKLLTRDDFS